MTAPRFELTASDIEGRLKNKSLRVQVPAEAESTNALLKQRAESGASEGEVVIARAQSAGRGRGGRSFFSPEGTGLYMSVLLRPVLAADAGLITPAAAVAAARAIERVSDRTAGIKWVNDIYLEGRKVCGILAEASPATGGCAAYCVLGVGVNIEPPEGGFPAEIADTAGALFGRGEAPADTAVRLAAEILDGFFELYADLRAPELYDEYKKRLFILGSPVTVLRDGGARSAVVTGLDESFNLLVRYDGGGEDSLNSGEVSLRV